MIINIQIFLININHAISVSPLQYEILPMSIYSVSNRIALDGMPISLSRLASLPLAIAALLLTAQAQAFLPTPASLVTTGELALDTNSITNTDRNIENNAKTEIATETDAKQLLTEWREKAKTENLAQHTTWRRLLYFVDDEKG